jgi:AraC-like DNA-binding protein
VKPLAIYFNHSCQTDVSIYQDFFGCHVHFDSEFNGIKIAITALEQPLIKHNPELHDLLCQHASKMVNDLAKKLPVEIITRFISNQLPFGVPEIEDAAQNLQMSVRTLQRKLGEHELTFTALVNNIRQDLAFNYLQNTNIKIIYITQMLGFSEQSAFQRAFKRWTGNTPKYFRDNH